MTQEQKKLYQLIDKKCRTLIMVCFSLLLVLTVARMVSANRTATWGNKLEEIEYQTGLTRAENLKLKSQLAEKTGGFNPAANHPGSPCQKGRDFNLRRQFPGSQQAGLFGLLVSPKRTPARRPGREAGTHRLPQPDPINHPFSPAVSRSQRLVHRQGRSDFNRKAERRKPGLDSAGPQTHG